MAIHISAQRSLIYSEFSEEKQKEWFSIKQKKFLSHIDTFYYVIYPEVLNWRDDPRKDNLIAALATGSAQAAASSDQVAPVFTDLYDGLVCKPFMHFNLYSYHFCLDNSFDVFVADSIPNKNTPPIFVQLRSNGLWLKGTRDLFDLSLDCVDKVLRSFGLCVEKVVENRFDYAFHTNYIQDPIKFFPEEHLKDMQVSSFSRWHKEGDFFADDIRCDYFTLGRRKSNNVFFRCYNKSKEVIEMGYKQFFIPIWYEKGLISKFDRYVLENTFMYGQWNCKERERCRFYLGHGQNPEIRNKIEKMLANPDTPFSDYKKLADTIVPDITIVCNLEFQCKRKFFYNIDKSIPELNCTDELIKDRIYSLLDQTKSITNFLTFSILRFVKYKSEDDQVLPRHKREMADWWKRLRSCKSFELPDDVFAEYCFSYQSNLDLQKVRNNTIKAAARTVSYYADSEDDLAQSFKQDFDDVLSHMNDNDIRRYDMTKRVSFNAIKRKKMQLDPAVQKEKNLVYAEQRYKSVFTYWLHGIYNHTLNAALFPRILYNAFQAVPESYQLFDEMYHSYASKFGNYNLALANICRQALVQVKDFEKVGDD